MRVEHSAGRVAEYALIEARGRLIDGADAQRNERVCVPHSPFCHGVTKFANETKGCQLLLDRIDSPAPLDYFAENQYNLSVNLRALPGG